MMTRVLPLVLALLVVLGACSSPTQSESPAPPSPSPRVQSPAPQTTSEADELRNTVLIIDGSGTMTTTDVAPSRMAAAQAAANALVDALPSNSQFGVITFGTNTGNSEADQAESCQDITTVVSLGAVDAANTGLAKTQIDALTPSGYTPIAGALQKAASMLPDGQGEILLVTDGEDTCAPPDPCETAQQLVAERPGLSISTVGLSTGGAANAQLACIANAGNGLFVTASDTSALIRRLQAAYDSANTKGSLSTMGFGVAQLGATYDELTALIPGFPAWYQFPYTNPVPGTSGPLAAIVWQDCTYVFSMDDQTLLAIMPEDALTVDGVAPGQSVSEVQQLYGEPKAVDQVRGTFAARYWADSGVGSAFTVVFDADPTTTPTAQVVRVYLCRCLEIQPPSTETVITTKGYSGIQVDMTMDEVTAAGYSQAQTYSTRDCVGTDVSVQTSNGQAILGLLYYKGVLYGLQADVERGGMGLADEFGHVIGMSLSEHYADPRLQEVAGGQGMRLQVMVDPNNSEYMINYAPDRGNTRLGRIWAGRYQYVTHFELCMGG